jgi:DNA-binding GntR family transcriptional regulator
MIGNDSAFRLNPEGLRPAPISPVTAERSMKAPIGQTTTGTITERVHDGLFNDIVVGRFEPGQAVSLRSIAERYEASMTPAREAVARFVADGVLLIRPNRTIIMPPLDLGQIGSVWRMRMLLETEAARLAAMNGQTTDKAAIRNAHEAVDVALRSGNVEVMLAAMFRFGLAIATAARDPLLSAFVTNLRLRSAIHTAWCFRKFFQTSDEFHGYSLSIQGLLVQAIEDGDPDTAAALRQVDLRSFRQFVVSQLDGASA